MANLSEYFGWFRQRLKLIDNGDGSYSPQVAVTGSGTALPVSGTVAVSPLPAPAADVFGSGGPPGALAVLANTGALAAGSYRVEIEVSSTNPASGGAYIYVNHETGTGSTVYHQAIVPTPGFASIVWGRIAVNAGDRIIARNDTAGAAGTIGAAAIRAYPIA